MRLEDVSGQYRTITGPVQAVNHVSFDILDDEIFGIAGESGCGKSTLLKLMYDIVRFPLELSGGRVVLKTTKDGQVRELSSGEIGQVWWDQISYVPQAAMSVLNPVYRIEDQFY
jgi:peptide/nickel transport system ATP-binding protein